MKEKEVAHICRNCVHYDIENVLNKKGHVNKDRLAKCLWVDRSWPSSIIPSARPRAGWMNPYDGNQCPEFRKAYDGRKLFKKSAFVIP